MKRHITSFPTRKLTKPIVEPTAAVKHTTGMVLSLVMLACSAILPAHAQVVYYGASSPTDWVGVAVSTNGRVFFQPNGFSETRTRYEVRSDCENTAGYTCQAIAVPSHWDVVVLSCRGRGRMGGYVGGSGMGNAEAVAYDRAYRAGFDPGECTQVYRY
jgi:hypothetical protein